MSHVLIIEDEPAIAETLIYACFAPLAPGIGALKVRIPTQPGVDGDAFGYSGAFGSQCYMYLPEPISGLLQEIYCRFYLRIGDNGTPKPIADTKMFRNTGNNANYAVAGGKFGIGATHWSFWGGNNNVGGGNLGWSGRYSWLEIPSDSKDSGIVPGIHAYDNVGINFPIGKTGYGSALYKNEWYCIESRLKLNTWTTDGSKTTDGEMDVWIDGKLASQQRNFSFRKGPLDYVTATPLTARPPFRELGVVDIVMNLYQGGVMLADHDMTFFHTGLVTSTSYIGPMNLSPAWLPAGNTVATVPEANTFASINPGESPLGGYTYSGGGTAFPLGTPAAPQGWYRIINDYSGGTFNPHYQHTPGVYGCMVFHGGGHSATNWNGIAIFNFNDLKYYIVCPGSLSCYPGNPQTCEYADGQPASPHSYDVMDVLGPEAGYPKGAVITVHRGGAFVENQFPTASVHLFDFNNQSLKWQRLYNSGAAGWADAFDIGHSSAYDYDLRRIWWCGQGNQVSYMPYFDLADNAQKKATITSTANSSPNSNPDSKTMRYFGQRQLLIMSDTVSYGNTTRRIFYFNTMNPSAGWTQATLSTPFPADWGFGFDYVPSIGKFVCFLSQDPAAMYTLEVPAVLTNPWTVTRILVASGAFNAAYVIGKRFAYSPVIGGIVYKAAGATTMKVYRP